MSTGDLDDTKSTVSVVFTGVKDVSVAKAQSSPEIPGSILDFWTKLNKNCFYDFSITSEFKWGHSNKGNIKTVETKN